MFLEVFRPTNKRPQRKQQIQHWKLYNALGLNVEGEEVNDLASLTFSSWLKEQLETLGVENVDDMALFEPEDLTFNGIPELTSIISPAHYQRLLGYLEQAQQQGAERHDGIGCA